MRLQQYINEKKEEYNDIDLLNNLIKKDCKQYLKILGNLSGLYRGMDWKNDLGKNQTRSQRTASGMSLTEQRYINNILQKNGHNKRKGVVFASGDIDNVTMFGTSYYIFPVGNISYTWIETQDINLHNTPYDPNILEYLTDTLNGSEDDLEKYADYYTHDIAVFLDNFELELPKNKSDKEIRKMVEDKFIKMFHTDKGFRKAWTNSYEIWIKCKEYYFANTEKYIWNTKAKKLF